MAHAQLRVAIFCGGSSARAVVGMGSIVTPHSCTVLVTGGSGFIGRRVVPVLGAGHRLRLLARRPLPEFAGPGVDVAYADGLSDVPALRRAMDGADVVVHLASVVHRGDATAEELEAVNVQGTRYLAAAAAAAGVSHFIFLSSIAAVGIGDGGPIDERTVPHPITRYGDSKRRAEDALFEAASATSMRATVLRPPMVYGPGMRGNPLRLFRALARHLPLPLAGVPNRRSALFVDNLVAAIVRLVEHRSTVRGVYNIADREIGSTEEFARACAAALGVRALLVPSPYRLLRAAGDLAERHPVVARLGFSAALAESVGGSLVLDTSRLARDIGFVPPHSQHAGLVATARWFLAS